VIGAGLTGATLARKLAESGEVVTVVDSRTHVAGNAYDYEDCDTGIRVHKYGPHLFHTSNEEVISFVKNYAEWIRYKHYVKARLIDGTHVPFPPNDHTLKVVPREKLIDTFYRPYTELMWGKPLEEVSPKILDRVPIKEGTDKFYFKDTFQALPAAGYTHLVYMMLFHPNINLCLGTTLSHETLDYGAYSAVFNCASIDQFFGNKYGMLPYRSIKFVTVKKYGSHYVQPEAPTVNYTEGVDRTRSTEWKQFPNSKHSGQASLITTEFPCDAAANDFERYYPVRTEDTIKLYDSYIKLAAERFPHMRFIGRCGSFTYLDMHQAINMGLQAAKHFVMEKK
jgi:UDP-galactopyranose mutase